MYSPYITSPSVLLCCLTAFPVPDRDLPIWERGALDTLPPPVLFALFHIALALFIYHSYGRTLGCLLSLSLVCLSLQKGSIYSRDHHLLWCLLCLLLIIYFYLSDSSLLYPLFSLFVVSSQHNT